MGLLMTVVVLMLIISYVFIDSHISAESILAESGVYDVSSKLFHLHRSRNSVVAPTTGVGIISSVGDVVIPVSVAKVESPKVSTPAACTLSFPQKCRMNPLVKYWDEITECYTSPFRALHGD
jgi:hypothetical protein